MSCLIRTGVLVLTVMLAVSGCSSGPKGGDGQGPGTEDRLQEVGGMLTLLGGEPRRGYSAPADLARFEAGFPLGYQAVKSGAIVVVKGASMPGEGDRASATEAIVAYEKQVPTEGGFVLLHNGTVKRMTAEEYRTAPKAGS